MTGVYEVWRKFWYQMTRADTHTVPEPSKSVAAYVAVCADMLKTPEKTFTKAKWNKTFNFFVGKIKS